MEQSSPATKTLRSVEIYSGAGGLGYGLHNAGFKHELVCDKDADACRTIRLNQALGNRAVAGWKVHECDADILDLSGVPPGLDLLAGGPPCQPFSIGGRKQGALDARDQWPTAIRAVRTLAPRAFLWENVRNIASTFRDYLDYIVLQLTFPELVRDEAEPVQAHSRRLTTYFQHGKPDGLHYRVAYCLLDAADYGTAQNRERVFVMGFRSDVDAAWTAPAATHSADALWHSKFITGAYWQRHGLRPQPAEGRDLARLRRLNSEPMDLFSHRTLPHITLRDATADLPAPFEREDPRMPNHVMPTRAARCYKGHTGSPIDKPAKALRAGVHGVSGGENAFDYGDGTYRHFTVREAARLQAFPDDYHFPGSWSTGLRLLGNAVPVTLAEAVGRTLTGPLG